MAPDQSRTLVERATTDDMVGTAIVRCSIRCILLEDAHPGSGSGGAGIDALVTRDRTGRYVVWREHLEGLLLDEARRSGTPAVTRESLFGTQGGVRQRALFTSLYSSGAPSSRVWRSSARKSFANRAPHDDTLRAKEFVPEGTEFTGRVELEERDVGELTRLLNQVEAIGAERNRGAGRVRLSLAPATVGPNEGTTGQGTTLRVLLRNLDPLCITATAMPGNLIPTHSFVPGQTLWGALVNWLLEEGAVDAATLLASEAVSVGNAYLVPGADIDGVPLKDIELLPAPLSLVRTKPAPQPTERPWWSEPGAFVKRLDRALEDTWDWKRPEDDLVVYRTGPGSMWQSTRPDIRVRLRNGRSVRDKDDPDLFSVEQIAEQSCWVADVTFAPDAMGTLVAALEPLLLGARWLRLGRGGTPVEVVRSEQTSPPPDDAPLPVPDTAPGTVPDTAYLTLTSELLARDKQLRWLTALAPDDVTHVEEWPKDVPPGAIEPIAQEGAIVRGFNGTARLPRLSMDAIRRGSVFRVKGREAVRILAHRAAHQCWLGEQQHLGFGRFRIDTMLPGVTTPEVSVEGTSAGAISGSAIPATGSTTTVADHEAIAKATREWAASYQKGLGDRAGSGERPPSTNQWRTLLAELYSADGDELPLAARLQPTTRGASTWRHAAARNVLERLRSVARAQRALHAWYFIRWIESERRAPR